MKFADNEDIDSADAGFIRIALSDSLEKFNYYTGSYGDLEDNWMLRTGSAATLSGVRCRCCFR